MGQNLGHKKSYLVVEIATTIENLKKKFKVQKKNLSDICIPEKWTKAAKKIIFGG
jgi:hypothetical protein